MDDERPPGLARAPAPREDYTGWLLVSYLSVPALAIGLPMLVSTLTNDDTLTDVSLFVGIAGALTMPMTVHLLHGEGGLALRAAVAMPLLIATGIFVGGVIGSAATSEEARQNDDDAGLSNALTGATVGAAIALVGWAAYDVIENANRRGMHKRDSTRAGLRVALVPHPGGIVACAALRL